MKAELIDRMGTDLTVVNAARVSFDKESEWGWAEPVEGVIEIGLLKAGTVVTQQVYDDIMHRRANPAITFKNGLQPKDQKLITYLAKHNHWTPFSHVMITMRETVPIFVARQRFKHIVGMTYNEVSRRYVNDRPEGFIPDSIRSRPEGSIKQGSGDAHPRTSYWMERYIQKLEDDFNMYDEMIADGVCPEQARMILPLATYTSYYATGSLVAWARAFRQRTDEHAQKEIQDLAAQWGDIIGNIDELNYSWLALTS
jgi:thymidylate synthase (FAD)